MTGSLTAANTALRSANADWVRALQRTAGIVPASNRTIGAVVAEAAHVHSDRPALIGENTSLTYSALATRSAAYARWALDQGLRKGDRVALLLDNQPDYAAIWIGLAQVGVVTALLNTQLVGDGLAHGLEVVEARHMIVGAAHLQAAADVAFVGERWSHGAACAGFTRIDTGLAHDAAMPAGPDVALRDPALLIFTSGTTGLPKAAHVSHYRIMMWSEWFAGIIDATPDDRLYDCLPMYHSIGGVVAIGAMLVAGGSVVIRNGFSSRRFWPDVVATGATIFQYIGELCRYLTAAPADDTSQTHCLRLCIGNGLRADVWERFAEAFRIPRIIEFYAATEGSFSLFNLEGQPGSIGRVPRFLAHRSPVALVRFDHAAARPLRGTDGFCVHCASGESGEALGMIAAEPSALATRFEGYTSATETDAKILRDVFARGDAWFRTGDLMRQDQAGYFYFVDRIGDTFRWKGENVATSEVADAVASCPGVRDVAVYGVAVPGADGRAGMAALVTEPGFDPAVLHAHLVARLPRYARPLFLRLCDAVAMTGTFKLKKRDLVREGFDPATITDPLFVAEQTAYVPLHGADHARIVSGQKRL